MSLLIAAVILVSTTSFNVSMRLCGALPKNPKLFTILDFTEYVDATRNKMPVKKQSIQIATQELAFAMAKQTDWDKVWNEFLTPEFRKSEKYRKMIANNMGGVYLSLLK